MEEDELNLLKPLLKSILSNNSLLKKLDLTPEDFNSKRKAPPSSPIRTKRFCISNASVEESSSSKLSEPKKLKKKAFSEPSCSTHVPNELPQTLEISDSPQVVDLHPDRDGMDHGEHISEQEDEEEPGDVFESMMCNTEELAFHDSDEDEASSEASEPLFKIKGAPPPPTWSVPEGVFSWFSQVADLDLNKEETDKIEKEFKTSKEVSKHFSPPLFPASLWSSLSSSSSDSYRVKTIQSAQDPLCLALKPLLRALHLCPENIREDISTAIQLICSANLRFNRFRRSTLAPHLKPELRKQILSIPVKHDALFGEDFSQSTDSFIKEQSALDKALIKKKPVQQRISFQKKSYPAGGSNRGGKSFRGEKDYYPSSNYQRGNSRGRFRGRKRFGNSSQGSQPRGSQGGDSGSKSAGSSQLQ